MRLYWIIIAILPLLNGQAVLGQYQALLDGGDYSPRFGVEYARPELHKWYGSRHLNETYAQPWYLRDATYARGEYRRYVDQLLEGAQRYDGFGNSLGRSWLVYKWTQIQPASQGSIIGKRPLNVGGRDTYSGFFSRLVIASDGDSRSSYRLMIGDEIYTSFTPLTLYKPRFNGMRLDSATDRYRTSLILSRPSEPNRDMRTDVTHIMGGHAEFDASADLRLGITYVSAHNANTKGDFTSGNPMQGILTSRQNQGLQDLWVSIRDDSPADGRGGPAVFSYDLVMVDTSGREIRGSEIGLLPSVEGGRSEGNSLVADGSERIVLHYDLRSLDAGGIRSVDLRRTSIELSLANDYRVEMTSDLQTDGQLRNPEPVFLTYDRAEGNVGDRSNSTVLRVDYALPTANELIGINWNLADWKGLSLQGEWVLNRRHGLYPSPNISRGYHAVDEATAAYGTLHYRHFPWAFYAEGFSLDDSYSTSYWLTEASGIIRYKNRIPQLYELVDDDDDSDALPEWERPLQPSNATIFPGYDENGDFVYDHNQNRNLQPDYDEPFLRFRSDRPEFLFGFDMNHNGTIDRFEDDDLPDYPYRRDQRGFNAYLRVNAGPDMELSLGRQQARLIAGDGRTESWYFMLAARRAVPGGMLRLFEHGALVKDDISDPINLWVQPIGAIGRMRRIEDALPGRDAWKNVFYADFEHRIGAGVRLLHRAKWEHWHQRDAKGEVQGRDGRVNSGFIGLIDKAEWSIPIGLAVVEPRFKSEYRKVRPFNSRIPASTVLEETLFLMWTQPILAESVGVAYYPRYGRQVFNTELQLGLELTWLRLLDGQLPDTQGDFSGWTTVGQLVNRVVYQGYQLAVRAGLRLGRRSFAEGRDQHTSLFFFSINAGL
ncbi:MAG: hypothetical protein ACKVJG_08405 [Candidatus Latescibacterota bacterium]